MKDCLGIVVIMLVFAIIWHMHACRKMLNGFWIADANYCEEAEIDSLMLQISGKDAYIIGIKDNQLFLNESTKISICNTPTFLSECYVLSINFGNIDNEQFPNKAKAKIYPYIGKMYLYDSDKTLYGLFYKDGNSTELQDKFMKADTGAPSDINAAPDNCQE